MKTPNTQSKYTKSSFQHVFSISLIDGKTFVDHLITIVIITFTIILFFALQLTAQEVEKKGGKDKDQIKAKNNLPDFGVVKMPNVPQATGDTVAVKDDVGNVLMTVTDEGTAGSIKLNDAGVVTISSNKLYNNGGSLYWNGSAVGSSGGADSINQLADAKYDGSSLFLGAGAGASDDGTNNWNTSVGYNSLSNNLAGERNTGLGFNSLQSNTSGTDNVAVGYLSLKNNLTGNYNVSVGREALGTNTGSNNTAIGHWALLYNSSGQYNVGIGKSTNGLNQTGSQNTMIGFEAGKGTSLHSKSGNVFIGYQAGLNEISSNKLYIENTNSPAPLIWGDFATDSLKINGDVHITGNLHIDGNSNSLTIGSSYQGGIIFWLDDTGKHGLIAATSDQSNVTYWSKPFNTITGATGDGIGAGEMNSMLMVSDSRIYQTAAAVCTDLVVNESGVNYGDWYLPSHDELKIMYTQKSVIGGFSNTSYWSSTELTFEYAKVVDFSTGNSGASFYKSTTTAVSVRAIRTF